MATQTLTVQTTALVAGGAALGRLPDGRAVFVGGGAPNELLRIELTHEDKQWARGRIAQILQPSPSRVEPPFPVSALGGATWAHLDYETQLQAKQKIVRAALERIGGLADPAVRPTVASPQQWRYRNRIELTFGLRDGQIILGTLAPGSDTQVVPATDSALFGDSASEIIPRVTEWARQSGLSISELQSLMLRRSAAEHSTLIHSPSDPLIHSASVEVSSEGKGGQTEQTDLVVNLVAAAKVRPDRSLVAALTGLPTTGVLWSSSAARGHLRGEWPVSSEVKEGGTGLDVLSGSPVLTERIAGSDFRYHTTSFFQTNVGAAELLLKQLRSLLSKPTEVVDLYAGVGLLGLVVAKPDIPLTLVESHAQACRDALENVTHLGRLDTTTVVQATAEAYVAQYPLPSGATVIIDPPRSGLHRTVVEALNRSQLSKLLYVSCDPATLARDLRLLASRYHPRLIQPFDFFPQTHHVETLVELCNV